MSHHRIRASIGDLHLHLVYRLDPDGIEILERKWHPVGPDILPENLREELLLRTINYLESSGAPVMIPPHNFTLASQLVGLDYQPRK